MDLELVETSELLDELLRRFDHVVFAGLKEMDSGRYANSSRWKGCHFTCSGAAQMLSERVIREWHASAEDAQPGDV